MVVCVNGSERQPAKPASYRVTDDDLRRWFGDRYSSINPAVWSFFFGAEFNVISLCSLDPPDIQPLTDADIIAMYTPFTFLLVKSKIETFIKYALWSEMCQCIAGNDVCENLTPTAISATGNNPFGGTYTFGRRVHIDVACHLTKVKMFFGTNSDVQFHNFYVWDVAGGSAIGPWTVNGGPGQGWRETVLPTPIALAAGHDYWIAYVLDSGSNDSLFSSSIPASNAFLTYVATWNANGPGNIPTTPLGSPGEYCGDFEVCGPSSAPTTLPAPTPPGLPTTPDYPVCSGSSTDDICNLLHRIENLITYNYSMTTLIQRQQVPFAYLRGSTHSVSGSGEFAVQGILGLSVAFTISPSNWGETAETPPRTIPAWGSIQFATGDGYSDNYQLHYDSQLVMFDAPYATLVRYNLRPGWHADITELVREAL